MLWIWISFILFVLLLLAVDLGLLNRNPHVVGMRESLLWSSLWIGLSLLFNILVYFIYEYHWMGVGNVPGHELNGSQAAFQYLTGYIIEKSLSIDNIFVIALIFSYFQIPAQYQHRVLFWGIIGALVLRGIMIWAGVILIHKFTWMIYIFGGLLIWSAIKLLVTQHETIEPEKSILIRWVKKIYPVSKEFDDAKFFTEVDGKKAVTPLFLALIAVESSDIIFAVDSIPAIFAVTRDPFIVFTSNIFAILGLRSLYFALAALIERFRYLKSSLVFVLAYVGVKMILSHHYPIKAWVSLCFIAGIFAVGIAASIYANHKQKLKVDM